MSQTNGSHQDQRSKQGKAAPKLTIEYEEHASEKTSEHDAAAGSSQGASVDETHLPTGEEAAGFLRSLGAMIWKYAESHRHTVLYGFVAFVLAVLILAIGLWNTIVITVFVFVGALLGQIRDGDNGIVNFFRRLFNNRG